MPSVLVEVGLGGLHNKPLWSATPHDMFDEYHVDTQLALSPTNEFSCEMRGAF